MSNLVGDSANPKVAGVSGMHSTNGRGVAASSEQGIALEAAATKDTAVYAHSESGIGLDGRSKTSTGVWGSSEQGIGVRGEGGQYAGYFDGNVMVTGDVQLQNADCAEDFDIVDVGERIQPGAVMVIDEEGRLRQCSEAYDKKVVGVISGAADYKPGIVLDRHFSNNQRLPIALLGKVYCKVDARYSTITVGDLLTTSSTPGHAMKATDPLKAFGAVLGKALKPLRHGTGLIPILVALQ